MIVADGSIKLNLLETAERIKRHVDPSLNCGWPLLRPLAGDARDVLAARDSLKQLLGIRLLDH